jgi:peptidyl-dipeptidase A
MNDRRRAELELELRRAKGDPEALLMVEEALAQPAHDAVLRRRLEVLRLSLLGNQMTDAQRDRIVELSTSVESDFASLRPEVDGRPLSANDIERILGSSNDDEERERAWTASKEIGALVAERVRELARARNEVARDHGFPDFFTMALELQEIPQEWLFVLLERVDELTAELFTAWKGQLDERLRRRFGVTELRPWHYADPFFQRLPRDGGLSLDDVLAERRADELARATFARWGVDLSRVLEGSDLYPRPAKSQHAFCLDVDRSGGDVRILGNVVPGERWVEVMLHESGHAAYDLSISPEVPYLLHRAAHTFVTEAVALFAGRLTREPRWLIDVAGVPLDAIEPLRAGLARASATHSLLFARWCLVVVHFERALYADPEGDLDARWWELVQRFQGVTPPPGRAAPDWAAKIHVATSPVYYHNYLLGEVLASQLRALCERSFGDALAPGVGELLFGDLCRGGALLSWGALVEATTGRSLAPEDYVAGVRAAL